MKILNRIGHITNWILAITQPQEKAEVDEMNARILDILWGTHYFSSLTEVTDYARSHLQRLLNKPTESNIQLAFFLVCCLQLTYIGTKIEQEAENVTFEEYMEYHNLLQNVKAATAESNVSLELMYNLECNMPFYTPWCVQQLEELILTTYRCFVILLDKVDPMVDDLGKTYTAL